MTERATYVTLVGMVAYAAIATDLYLPAIPAMVDAFGDGSGMWHPGVPIQNDPSRLSNAVGLLRFSRPLAIQSACHPIMTSTGTCNGPRSVSE